MGRTWSTSGYPRLHQGRASREGGAALFLVLLSERSSELLALGEAEHEIDSLYTANPLLGSPFAHAAWMVLTAWEGRFTDWPARRCNFESLVNRQINY